MHVLACVEYSAVVSLSGSRHWVSEHFLFSWNELSGLTLALRYIAFLLSH